MSPGQLYYTYKESTSKYRWHNIIVENIMEKNYKIEGDLKRELMLNVKRLKDVKSYRGSRHAKNLPVRGQRTKTNSRTKRGNKRVTVGSGRVSVAKK